MRIDILTLFPEYFDQTLRTSILGRAQTSSTVEFFVHNLRDWALDTHGTVDDTPYGGGPGMVLKVDVMKRALDDITTKSERKPYTVLLTPQGKRLEQSVCRALAVHERILLICGHYEGYDERIRDYVDAQISIGDYVLTGGEPAALVVIDAVVRLLPGVTGHQNSTLEESHSLTDESGQILLEYPQYTRPEEFEGKKVPNVLLSGNHQTIKNWRLNEAKKRTFDRPL